MIRRLQTALLPTGTPLGIAPKSLNEHSVGPSSKLSRSELPQHLQVRPSGLSQTATIPGSPVDAPPTPTASNSSLAASLPETRRREQATPAAAGVATVGPLLSAAPLARPVRFGGQLLRGPRLVPGVFGQAVRPCHSHGRGGE